MAAIAGGGILGSLVLSRMSGATQPARMMLIFNVLWHGLVILLGQVDSLASGLLLLPLIGIKQMQILCVLPMAVLLLSGTPPALRGRIMGMCTLAVYGLLCSGPLIDHLEFRSTTVTYGTMGILVTLLVLRVWRSHLWPKRALGNIG